LRRKTIMVNKNPFGVPDMIEILGARYTIKTVEKLNKADDVGECNIMNKTITLKYAGNICRESYRDTLIHELTHALLDRLGLNNVIPRNVSEVLCDALGQQIFILMSNNKWLLKV